MIWLSFLDLLHADGDPSDEELRAANISERDGIRR